MPKKRSSSSRSLPFAHYILGLLYTDLGDYRKAIVELELAEKKQIHEADLYYSLGQAYARTGRKSDAERARTTFRRLSAEASAHQDEPNIYGEQRPLRPDPSGQARSRDEVK